MECFCGDFNDSYESSLSHYLRGEASDFHFLDSQNRLVIPDSLRFRWISGYNVVQQHNLPTSYIDNSVRDHVFFSEDVFLVSALSLKVEKVRDLFRKVPSASCPSDHVPLYLELGNLKKSAISDPNVQAQDSDLDKYALGRDTNAEQVSNGQVKDIEGAEDAFGREANVVQVSNTQVRDPDGTEDAFGGGAKTEQVIDMQVKHREGTEDAFRGGSDIEQVSNTQVNDLRGTDAVLKKTFRPRTRS
jgi:hypothetical protein